MGSLEQIDHLEAHIDELGNQIVKIKKASEYLKLIEQIQSEITQTSSTLSTSRDQLKLYQEIMESKLELFQTTARNIEAKQQLLEQTQLNIIASLSESKQQQYKSEKDLMAALTGINQLVNHKHEEVIVKLNLINTDQEGQNLVLNNISKTSRIYFMINAGLIVLAAGILIYLLLK